MKQKSQDELQTYEQQLLQRLQSAQQRAQQARDEQMYYRGQTDALSDALSDIRNFSVATNATFSSLHIPRDPEHPAAPETPSPVQSLITPSNASGDILEENLTAAPQKRGRKKKQAEEIVEAIIEPPKKRGRKPAMPPAPKTPYQILAREAVDLKVILRRASWFYHKLLPQGLIKGLQPLEKMLEENVAFREAIQAACDEKKAFIPADEAMIASASGPEQSAETSEAPILEQPAVMAGATTPEQPEGASEAPDLEQPLATAGSVLEEIKVAPEKKRRRRQKQVETSPKEEMTPQKRGRKPVAHAVPKVSEFELLAREAVDLGVFTRKASWFYHQLLPQGLIKGLYQLEKLLERDATLREAIQAECAAKRAFVPAEEVVTEPAVSEPVVTEPAITDVEPMTEPFQEAA